MDQLKGDKSQLPPLAERMRPLTLDDVLGQEEILANNGPLRTLIEGGRYHAFLFWGPPGTGKTTVGRIMARHSGMSFVHFSAALSGVNEVRAALEHSRNRYEAEGRRDLLFLDEIHRFNKAQQDVLLSYLEKGSVIFVGATTENPSFALNAALLSRCQLFSFSELSQGDLSAVLRRALENEDGLSGRYELTQDAEDFLIAFSDGDARRALSALELASAIVEERTIDAASVEKALQQKGLRYDRAGEEHYNLISALHKSVRNSDPDASLYWLARMIEGGEDPRFLARRLIRIASEDIGMADPQALQVAVATRQTVEMVGLPECDLALAEVVVYLSLAPKSNSLYVGLQQARKDVETRPNEPVPLQLRNAPTRMMKDLDYGKGYKYAHDYKLGVTSMECLPPSLQGTRYYRPKRFGLEKQLRDRLRRINKAKRLCKEDRESASSG